MTKRERPLLKKHLSLPFRLSSLLPSSIVPSNVTTPPIKIKWQVLEALPIDIRQGDGFFYAY